MLKKISQLSGNLRIIGIVTVPFKFQVFSRTRIRMESCRSFFRIFATDDRFTNAVKTDYHGAFVNEKNHVTRNLTSPDVNRAQPGAFHDRGRIISPEIAGLLLFDRSTLHSRSCGLLLHQQRCDRDVETVGEESRTGAE